MPNSRWSEGYKLTPVVRSTTPKKYLLRVDGIFIIIIIVIAITSLLSKATSR